MRCSSLILFSAFILMTSCVTTYPKSYTHSLTDFRPYTESGLFITEDQLKGMDVYPAEYIPLEKFRFTFYSGLIQDTLHIVSGKKVKSNQEDDIYASGRTTKQYSVQKDKWTMDEIYDVVIQNCKDLGAEGIYNYSSYQLYDTRVISGVAFKVTH